MGDISAYVPNMKIVSLSNPVPGEVCTDYDDFNDGQSMIVQGSLVDKSNEPKTQTMMTSPRLK